MVGNCICAYSTFSVNSLLCQRTLFPFEPRFFFHILSTQQLLFQQPERSCCLFSCETISFMKKGNSPFSSARLSCQTFLFIVRHLRLSCAQKTQKRKKKWHVLFSWATESSFFLLFPSNWFCLGCRERRGNKGKWTKTVDLLHFPKPAVFDSLFANSAFKWELVVVNWP